MKFYRYETRQYGYAIDDESFSEFPNVQIECLEYEQVRKTPKGSWIRLAEWDTLPRWISDTSKKRFAYPTKEEALNSFKIRKKRQIEILGHKLKVAKISLGLADYIKID